MERDAELFARQIKGTPLSNNWRPMAVVRAKRQKYVGANLNKYVQAVASHMASVEDVVAHLTGK